jgi:hypothetical protein
LRGTTGSGGGLSAAHIIDEGGNTLASVFYIDTNDVFPEERYTKEE